MKRMKMLAAVGLMITTMLAGAAEPDAAAIKAAHDLMASMQAEKMMRMTAGSARYASPAQRQEVMTKVINLSPELVYSRLAAPVARLLSTETSLEMTRFYQSSYGKKVLYGTYNSQAQLYATAPPATAAEKAELKKPAYIKADKEFKANEQAINHETFLLLKSIINGK